MAKFPGFIGPTYTVRSPIAGADRTVNWYLERQEVTGQPWFVPTPGLDAWLPVGTGPVRGMYFLNRRAWVVSGASFFEIFPNQQAILRGFVTNDGNPATIVSNGTAGNQVFIVSGGNGYIFNTMTNIFGQISDPEFPTPASIGFFLDGYFGAVRANSTEWKLSNLLDGMAWDALDIFQRSWASDNIVSAITNHRELWLLGSQTSEVWVNTGSITILEPLQGVFIEGGSGAVYSAAQLDNTIVWMDSDVRGDAVIRRANGYTPERISTHAVEYALNTYEKLDDAIGFSYSEEGHAYYLLYVPAADVTWVYDANAQLWHERANWNTDTMLWEPWTGRAHCFAAGWSGRGVHLIGDRQSGVIYQLSLDKFSDSVVSP